ncbi:MAG: hypothetical protein QOE92_212 [Chloroflexota bacterium]|jgi:CDGSH-type Zn-finger protein|nr:hypothetical protein [Chloroflexota bacterium]
MTDIFKAPGVVIVRDNGPLRVMGPVDVVDAVGDVIRHIPAGERQAFCRCNQSSDKPFCDGTHKHIAYRSMVRAADFGAALDGDGREP